MATRVCGEDGKWAGPPNVLECQSVQFIELEEQVMLLLSQTYKVSRLEDQAVLLMVVHYIVYTSRLNQVITMGNSLRNRKACT